MWQIIIKPYSAAGTGDLGFFTEIDGESRHAVIVENYCQIDIHGENRLELFEGILNYGNLTGRIDKASAEKWLQEHPDFQPLTAEERSEAEKNCPAELRHLEQIEETIREVREWPEKPLGQFLRR